LREEAVDRTVWGTSFGRGCGNIVKRTRNDDYDDYDDDDDDDNVSGQKLQRRKGSFLLFIFKTSKLLVYGLFVHGHKGSK